MTRNCTGAKFGGICHQDGEGNNETKESICQPIDGQWSDWFIEEDSDEICHENTSNGLWFKSKWRNCTNPEPKFGGKDCHDGYFEEEKEVQCRPIRGFWKELEWQTCSENCTQYRSKTCTNPIPAYGGKNCSGPDFDTQFCLTENCFAHDCFEHSLYWNYDILGFNTTLENPVEECQNRCKATNDCSGFVMKLDGQCSLKRKLSKPMQAVSPAHLSG